MAFIESTTISSYEEKSRRERFPMPLNLNPKLISDSAILLLYCAQPKDYSSTGLWFPEDMIDSEATFPHKALHWMALNCQEILLLRMPNHVIDIASAELFETFLAKWSTLILRDPYYPVKFTHPNQSRFNSYFLSRIIPTSASLGSSFIILVVSRDPLELYSNKCESIWTSNNTISS